MNPSDNESGRLEREMGLAHADFWRLLPQAVGELPYRVDGNRVHIDIEGGVVEIVLGGERERRIALMSIPVTPVTIRWEGLPRARFEAFLARFDSYYRRGGG